MGGYDENKKYLGESCIATYKAIQSAFNDLSEGYITTNEEIQSAFNAIELNLNQLTERVTALENK